MVNNGEELLKYCSSKNKTIWQYAIETEVEESELGYVEVFEKMRKNLKVMENSSEKGLKNKISSVSGLIGGDAYKINEYEQKGNTLTGSLMVKAMARSMSCSEVNAAMGRIVACPTAGSCGILPAVIISAGEKLNLPENELVKALFTASGVGMIIARNATLAGAEGGCQAECGSAAAMGAAAVVEMMGGSPQTALDAAAIVIKNILGLVCDPIAGLVEVPCAKRNVAGTVSALATADLVMSGVRSIIPFDDVVYAMYKVGRALPSELRETALGGLAVTKKGLELKRKVLKIQ